ncbi:MAG: beta-lactamase family protein, partial [Myxococcales bacterium]|nr:beta-lactamase family protein [Myxococcales bacterium]
TSKGLAFLRAYGHRSLVPERQPMAVDTLFDLASLTKPVVTATAIGVLIDRGALRLDDPVQRYLPTFSGNGKDRVTLRDLLLHRSGMPSVNTLRSMEGIPRRVAIDRIATLPLESPPGEVFRYSDLGYILLGEVVERVSGKGLADFARGAILDPLGMVESAFNPGPDLRDRVAVTEQTDKRGPEPVWIAGEVHDPRAYRLGGVAGNAGLFATASDLARYAEMLLGHGARGKARVLSPETFRALTTPVGIRGTIRTPGWDVRSSYGTQRSKGFSEASFGHGGYTGTSLWVDPLRDLYVAVLTNRVHPEPTGDMRPLARAIGDVALAFREQFLPSPRSSLVLGIDVLRRDQFDVLRGAKVGLLTNVSGRARDGVGTAELLHRA